MPSISIRSLPDLGSDHYPILVKIAIGPDRMIRKKRSKWIIEEEKWKKWGKKVWKHDPKVARNQEEELENFMESILIPSIK